MEQVRQYPLHKDLARRIATREKTFWSDEELAGGLVEDIKSDAYQFELMGLIKELLFEHQIDFIRSEDPLLGKGYKIATSEESVEITVERLHRKQKRALYKNRVVLDTIDRNELSTELKDRFDRQMIRCGAFITAYNKITLSKCVPGLSLRLDVPKMITK